MKKESDQQLEIYKLFVGSALAVTTQRQVLNAFFVTVNSGILGLAPPNGSIISIFVDFLVNIIWYLSIVSYKQLNKAKFEVIHKMEKELPFSPFKDEWELVEKDKRIDFTALEKWIPLGFWVFYTWCSHSNCFK
jgi:hypothetical protein